MIHPEMLEQAKEATPEELLKLFKIVRKNYWRGLISSAEYALTLVDLLETNTK